MFSFDSPVMEDQRKDVIADINLPYSNNRTLHACLDASSCNCAVLTLGSSCNLGNMEEPF